jgi:hypothetical protein
MFESDKKSPLESAKKSLYSRTEEIPDEIRHNIHGSNESVPEAWKPDEELDPLHIAQMKSTRKTYSYVFLGTLLFFVIAALIGGYTLFGGKNFVSADNVNILIEGPTAISGGENLDLNVSVENKNATNIEAVALIVEFPEGTKDPNDPLKDLTRLKLDLGNIRSQSVAQQPISALLYGEEGAVKEIKFRTEYKTANSSAIFYKEKSGIVSISSSPVIVSIDALDKVLNGQPSEYKIVVSSNTTAPIKNLLLTLDYPFGFTVASSNPQPSYGNNVWRIGDLAPGAKRTITIQGTAEGQSDEERTIRANVGVQSQSSNRDIGTTIVSRSHSFSIEKPFFGIDLTFNGDRGDAAVDPGTNVRGEIIWTNNSSYKINNARIEAKLSGNVLNKNSVTVSDGYYDSLSNTIIWEAGRTSGLLSIAPGESGRVGFTFASYNSAPGQSTLNPMMNVTVSAKGTRADESGVPQEISAAVSRSVKLVSNLALSARALHNQGPITNNGPIPPKAEKATTYTVIWTVTNTSNNITGAKVTASLPPYVTWTQTISPNDANIKYDEIGGNITWNVGSVPRNADSGSSIKQVAFQVSLQPSVTQIGTVPSIIGPAKITGTDAYTGVTVTGSAPGLTTRTTTDQLYREGDDVVQP